jgi:hypothetical protein
MKLIILLISLTALMGCSNADTVYSKCMQNKQSSVFEDCIKNKDYSYSNQYYCMEYTVRVLCPEMSPELD